MNYGALPGLQLHVIAPLAYAHASGGSTFYGVADVELGAKFRFIDESARRLVLDLTGHHHLLFSAGRGIVGNSLFQGYAAYQLTL